MAKAHRGTGIRKELNHGRGTCPVCNRTEIKVLYENEIEGEKKVVCKQCNAHIKHAK